MSSGVAASDTPLVHPITMGVTCAARLGNELLPVWASVSGAWDHPRLPCTWVIRTLMGAGDTEWLHMMTDCHRLDWNAEFISFIPI